MWLGTFTKRKKITIDATKIDSDVTHLSVVVNLDGDTDFFGELGAGDSLKVAFTKADGTTELYGEVEQFDSVNSKAVYHVSKSDWTISSSADTDFYIYYDSTQSDNTTYIGVAGSRTEVWETNAVAKWNLSETSDGTAGEIKDSTSNGNDGTGVGFPTQGAGKVDGALEFDGTGDYVNAGKNTYDMGIRDSATFCAWINLEPASDSQTIFSDWKDSKGMTIRVDGDAGTANTIQFYVYPNNHRAISTGTVTDNEWNHVCGVMDTSNVLIYINSNQDGSDTLGENIGDSVTNLLIGNRGDLSSIDWFSGKIDEVQIFNRALSAQEIKALYNSTNDTLVSYGAEETESVEVTHNTPFFGCNF